MKYIIEIKPEYEDSFKGLMILGAKDSNLFVDTIAVENIEELNSDYINEHYGQLQDDAYERGHGVGYQKGYKDCEKRYCSFDACPNRQAEYQRGLDDAWEAAKKIALMDTETSENVTGYFGLFRIMENLTPMQAIEKLKAYEEKQNDKIEVGDEVIYNGTTKCIVVRPEDDERYASLIDGDGTHYSADHRECKKTGRHFDIASILEDMRND